MTLEQPGQQAQSDNRPDSQASWQERLVARDKTLPAEVREQLVSQAKALGFATEKLIWVEQKRDDAN